MKFLLLLISVAAVANTATKKSFQQAFEDNIRLQLSARMGMPVEQFRVSVESLATYPKDFVYRGENVQVLGLGTSGSKRLDGLFNVSISLEGRALSQTVGATGILRVQGPAVVASKNLQRGHVIEMGDLQYTTMNWGVLPSGATGLGQQSLIGQRVRNYVGKGDSLFEDLLDEPLDVQSNDMVELTVISGPGVMIRSRALARQDGRIGDVVRVEQPDTKKSLSVQITGKKAVEVRL
jgi:flagella basal body P-ring formation protein FlgA